MSQFYSIKKRSTKNLIKTLTIAINLLLNTGLVTAALAGILLLHEQKDSETETGMVPKKDHRSGRDHGWGG